MGKYLERINFINNKAPWLNDINLNKLQENVEDAITELHSQGVATGDTLPLGAVIEWYSDTIPENWLLCNGQNISRTDYPELFNVLGTKYGTGNGSTTFGLPNLKGKVPVGKSAGDIDFSTLGKIGGEKTHILTTLEIPKHNHGINTANGQGNLEWGYSFSYGNDSAYNGIMQEVGGNEAHNNLQPYIVCNFIIKAKQSSGLVANVIDNLESSSGTDALSAKQGKILNEKTEKKVLWENTKNLNSFSTQSIVLSSNDYDYLIIYVYRNYTGNSKKSMSVMVEKNKSVEINYCDYFDGRTRAWSRLIEISNNINVSIGDSTIEGSISNNTLVPYKIIGCKY